MVGGYHPRTKQQMRSLQIPVDRAHKSASVAAHGDPHEGGREPFGSLCPQPWAKRVCGRETDCRASSSIGSSNHIIFGAPQAPETAAAVMPRALAEPPAGAAAGPAAPEPARAEVPLAAPTAEALAATAHSACWCRHSSAACTISSSDSTSRRPTK